ncbi:HTH-type transcriptional activator HxlR [Lentilactobacillus diolivorans DSM 14421]|uniref:HTH-type transcriptional activator HxlR n=1 Tax=Lentilactobacillus diolivorans DSM 14421 TaxID=1423739 RepID=A0A0R1SNB0_9LACO|nr:HTH-type transcriptional activator HxlR [Lentilactobacillus diolivorans DSM 14421]
MITREGIYVKRHIYNCQAGCPVESTLQIIAGKWKSVIIYHLLTGTQRFNDLQKEMPDCSRRMLALQLKELQVDGVIQKKVYPVIPVKTEYSLTKFGLTLKPVILAMEVWGKTYNQRASRQVIEN